MTDVLSVFRTKLLELDDISQLTDDLLSKTLMANEQFLRKHHVGEIVQITARYFSNPDHGFNHSLRVWQRCQQIIEQCPMLWNFCQFYHQLSIGRCQKILMWASVFHDFSRFYGVPFVRHEEESACLAGQIFKPVFDRDIVIIINTHDYFSPLVDGYDMTFSVKFPLAEIFRLADKTSISPDQEVVRYYETGKEQGVVFFNPDLSNHDRFDFPHNLEQRDELTWMLMILALQPKDFLYRETAEVYERWARGKTAAIGKIFELAGKEKDIHNRPIDSEEIERLVFTFCDRL